MRCQIKLTCCKTALAWSNTWGRSTGSIPLAKPTTDFVLLHVLPLPFIQANSRKMPREMTHGSTRTTLTSHGSYEDKLTSPWPNCLIRLKKTFANPRCSTSPLTSASPVSRRWKITAGSTLSRLSAHLNKNTDLLSFSFLLLSPPCSRVSLTSSLTLWLLFWKCGLRVCFWHCFTHLHLVRSNTIWLSQSSDCRKTPGGPLFLPSSLLG